MIVLTHDDGDARNLTTKNISRQQWESLADELRSTQDIQRIKELVMALEETIFNRQQELVLHADKIDRREIEDEERGLKEVLDLMLEVKVKKLGFPAIP